MTHVSAGLRGFLETSFAIVNARSG